jgi:hypothetical protein
VSATREQILDALLVLLTSAAPSPFATAERRWTPWPDDKELPVAQPAIFLLCPGNTYVPGANTPPRRMLNCEAWVFAKPPAATTQPGDVSKASPGEKFCNDLLDAIDAMLDAGTDPTRGRITLSGRVNKVEISGEVRMVSGDLDPDGQCFMAIPINVLVP